MRGSTSCRWAWDKLAAILRPGGADICRRRPSSRQFPSLYSVSRPASCRVHIRNICCVRTDPRRICKWNEFSLSLRVTRSLVLTKTRAARNPTLRLRETGASFSVPNVKKRRRDVWRLWRGEASSASFSLSGNLSHDSHLKITYFFYELGAYFDITRRGCRRRYDMALCVIRFWGLTRMCADVIRRAKISITRIF